MLGLNDENKELREHAERVLTQFKKLELKFKRTRDKVVEKTEWGYRIRYVERNKKRHDKRLSENGTGHERGTKRLSEEHPE